MHVKNADPHIVTNYGFKVKVKVVVDDYDFELDFNLINLYYIKYNVNCFQVSCLMVIR